MNNMELFPGEPQNGTWTPPSRDVVLAAINSLTAMHKAGALGGEVMPEDAHPGLSRGSRENYHYFTLTMALNYQRNSYRLWPAATKTILDPEAKEVFEPGTVSEMGEEKLRDLLMRHRLALQPTRHTQIWQRVASAIADIFAGDIRNLFEVTHGDVGSILETVQVTHKRRFPYLSGEKICHYWIYVMEQYTDCRLKRRELISVAPDTHVIQASERLGLVPPGARSDPKVQQLVANSWRETLRGSGLSPIDIHTPLWLWSRAGFPPLS